MASRSTTYEALLAKIRDLDPLLVEAIDECDEGLLEAFGALPVSEKIRMASGAAEALSSFGPS